MAFEVIPAIDLVDGEVVRLSRGELDQKTVYGSDPCAVAEEWEAKGAARIHVVDLQGAVEGKPRHREVIEAIITRTRVPIQVAGGIRDIDALRRWVDVGADRVVLGTAALRDPAFLRESLEGFAERVVVALDARDREVRLAGWREGSGLDLVEAARDLAAAGVRRLLCTDISRDGMLAGPNLELLSEVAEAGGIPVIASGGVSTANDVAALARLASHGIEGVVVGRALYTGDLDLGEAIGAVG